MVKKINNKLNIDYQNGIIEDCLLQIRSKNKDELSFIKSWCLTINPIDSSKIIALIKEIENDPISYQHIKRINKVNGLLKVIVCSYQYMDELTLKGLVKDINYTNIELVEVPSQIPSTKELAVNWSKHWPLLWKGNPNDQILNELVFDINQIKLHLLSISRKSVDSTDSLPIFTAVVNPKTNELITISKDTRHSHPLEHSVMNAINEVSIKQKQKKDDQYLLYGYHVYTTHEPCTMCSMALIHSRITRLIYLQKMKKTGGLTGNIKNGNFEGIGIHENKLLNSKFDVFEWTGDEMSVGVINEEVNA